MKLLDEVLTNDGRATIVGFPNDTQVEVRLIEQAGLVIKDRVDVTEIASKKFAQEFEAQSEESFQAVEEAKALHGDDVFKPTGRDGRPLKGVALRNYLRAHPDEA